MRLAKILFACVVLAAIAAGGAWTYLESWADTPVSLSAEAIIDFPPGTSLSHLSAALAQEHVMTKPALFHAWVRLNRTYPHFQAGKYRFTDAVTPRSIAEKIIRGEIYEPVVLSVTIPEGFMLKQVIERLAANQVGQVVELTHLASDDAFLKALKVPGKTLEGYLYPATYNFTKVPTGETAFTKMVVEFWSHLPKDYVANANARGLSLADAVTFASMIERETMLDDERNLVSEVIWRRLKDRVPLGIDATIPYGIEDYDGDLKWKDLSNAKNPYNSRIYKGLPPTAIGAPSAKSLAAVLSPAHQGYYYYVLMPGTNRHHFSKTLKEHSEHVKLLVKAFKQGHGGAAANHGHNPGKETAGDPQVAPKQPDH